MEPDSRNDEIGEPKPRRVLAVGADPDHPTNEQGRGSPQATEWAKARGKERAQLEKYGVFTKIPQIAEGAKVGYSKWVYVIKWKPDGTIDKYKARKWEGDSLKKQVSVMILIKPMWKWWALRPQTSSWS